MMYKKVMLLNIFKAAMFALLIISGMQSSRADDVDMLIQELKVGNGKVRWKAAKVLGKIGDTRAVDPLIAVLKLDWYLNLSVAEALSQLAWKPQFDKDKVHFWVAQRKGDELRRNWVLTKKVLLKDVESFEYLRIKNALFTFIGIGKEDIISILIEKLYTKGNKTLAEAYLNCGNGELSEEAKEWARMHGYSISADFGNAPVGWGRW